MILIRAGSLNQKLRKSIKNTGSIFLLNICEFISDTGCKITWK